MKVVDNLRISNPAAQDFGLVDLRLALRPLDDCLHPGKSVLFNLRALGLYLLIEDPTRTFLYLGCPLAPVSRTVVLRGGNTATGFIAHIRPAAAQYAFEEGPSKRSRLRATSRIPMTFTTIPNCVTSF